MKNRSEYIEKVKQIKALTEKIHQFADQYPTYKPKTFKKLWANETFKRMAVSFLTLANDPDFWQYIDLSGHEVTPDHTIQFKENRTLDALVYIQTVVDIDDRLNSNSNNNQQKQQNIPDHYPLTGSRQRAYHQNQLLDKLPHRYIQKSGAFENKLDVYNLGTHQSASTPPYFSINLTQLKKREQKLDLENFKIGVQEALDTRGYALLLLSNDIAAEPYFIRKDQPDENGNAQYTVIRSQSESPDPNRLRPSSWNSEFNQTIKNLLTNDASHKKPPNVNFLHRFPVEHKACNCNVYSRLFTNAVGYEIEQRQKNNQALSPQEAAEAVFNDIANESSDFKIDTLYLNQPSITNPESEIDAIRLRQTVAQMPAALTYYKETCGIDPESGLIIDQKKYAERARKIQTAQPLTSTTPLITTKPVTVEQMIQDLKSHVRDNILEGESKIAAGQLKVRKDFDKIRMTDFAYSFYSAAKHVINNDKKALASETKMNHLDLEDGNDSTILIEAQKEALNLPPGPSLTA